MLRATIEKRLRDFRDFLNLEVIMKDSGLSRWMAAPTIDKLNINIGELENLGTSYLSRGLNCSADDKDGDMTKYGSKLKEYIDFQENLFLELTSLDLNLLCCPNVCKIYGKPVNGKSVIYPTSYRLGYYVHQLKNNINNLADHKTIVEIGGGFGTLCYFLKKILSSTYVIVDIPQTLINIGYILHKYGMSFLFYNELNNINYHSDNKEKTTLLVPPAALESLNKCDIVLAMDCMSEFPKVAIDYYIKNIKRLKPSIFYVDYTNLLHGDYFDDKLRLLWDYELSINQRTPITCYMHHYITGHGDNDIMTEKMFINE